MKISTTHKKFAEYLGKPDALENPQDYLGPNASTVLNFWLYLDKLDEEQLRIVGERYRSARDAASVAAAWATCELIVGKHLLLENNVPIVYLKMFENL